MTIAKEASPIQALTADDPTTLSENIVASNIEQLRTRFPEAFTEGKVDFAVLRQLLGGAVADQEEKYGLNWHGKRRARQLALTPSTGTLRPSPEDSADWDTTRNAMIEGDNLEVLKLLQKSYARKIKLIYIDPPYNTGQDFVYPDDLRDSISSYLELTGQSSGGSKLSSNTEASGRFHTAWLDMMYPRLRLARALLSNEGLIVISIDDAELANLTLIVDELFGEENHVATLVWDRNRKNDAKFFSTGHEYMLVYAKNKQRLVELGTVWREPKAGIDEAAALFQRLKDEKADNWERIAEDWRGFYRALPDDDPRKPIGRFTRVGARGPYRDDGDISWPGGGGPKYEVLHPRTKQPCKVPAGGWVYPTPLRFWEEVASGRVVFGPDESTLPRQCRFLFEGDGQVMRSVNFSYAQTATLDFVSLMQARVFDNPKYWNDLRRIVQYVTSPDDIVLDFFAGSGSIGHAVMAQNALDGGNRRFVLVQLPEPLDPSNVQQAIAAEYCDGLGKPRNIAEITKERLRRSAEKIKNESKTHGLDLGFRVFKLDSSNIRAWEPDRENLDQTLLDHQEHLKADRTEMDVLYELLLKLGLDLCVPIEQRTIVGKAVHSIGGGVVIACLARMITPEEVEPLAQGIVTWYDELKVAGDATCIFRDSALVDDVGKANLVAVLSQHGIENVRSL